MADDFTEWLNTAAGLSDRAQGLLLVLAADRVTYFDRYVITPLMQELIDAGLVRQLDNRVPTKLCLTQAGMDRAWRIKQTRQS